MSRLAVKIPRSQAVEDAVKTAGDTAKSARAKGLELVSDNLPKVAEATDRIGKAVADFVAASSRSIAERIREPSTLGQVGTAISTSWALRKARQFAVRNPALLIGGVAVAAVGLWWLTRPASPAEAEAAA